MAVNRTDFLAYIRAQTIRGTVGGQVVSFKILEDDMADDDTEVDYYMTWAWNTVWRVIETVCIQDFEKAVYALGFHLMVMFSQLAIFDDARAALGLFGQYQGVISSTSDVSTSSSRDMPNYFKELHPSEIQYQLTYWGRLYFNIVSRYSQHYGFAVA